MGRRFSGFDETYGISEAKIRNVMRKILIISVVILWGLQLQAQDEAYARKMLHKLTSRSMKGRGYVGQGDKKAADFIAGQLEKDGLLSFTDGYFQHYELPMNTFPGKVEVKVDGKKLKPGYDFVVSSAMPSVKGAFELVFAPETVNNDSTLSVYLKDHNFDSVILVVHGNFKKYYGLSVPCTGVIGFVQLIDKQPWWHVSDGYRQASTYWIKSTPEYFPQGAKTVTLDIETEFYDAYPTQNVIAYVKGKTSPDRFIAFTAHYDHLGMMGKACFPGANDNGSGTSMLLDLAAYYSKPENQPEKSIVFMFFSGEEAGLKGSGYYVSHPLFPLEEIDFLINLDMVGTGSEGITVVNTKAYRDVLETLTVLNDEYNYVPEIKPRGEACNSDHCHFYQAGVKSVFIYTRGQEHTAYHSVYDTDKKFPFTVYDGLFRLLTQYVNVIQ
jgi:hypothetical protein